jgi:flavin-binding protein dodecin
VLEDGECMPVVKVIELVGTSSKGFQDAVEEAVREASRTVRNLVGIDVLGWTGKIDGGKIVEYRANVKISFLVEDIRGQVK